MFARVSIGFALCVTTLGIGYASFDLMLIPSANGRVTRFDPINRVILGQFGPTSDPTQVFTGQTGIWVNSGSGRYASYNYATGEIVNQYSVIPNFSSNTIAGNLAHTVVGVDGNLLKEISLQTGASATLATLNAANTYYQVLQLPNGSYFLTGKNAAGNLFSETYSFSGLLLNTHTTTANVFSGTVGQMGIIASGTGYKVAAFHGTGGGSPSPVIRTFTLNSSGSVTSSNQIGVSSTTWSGSAMPAIVAGHSGLWCVGANSTSPSTSVTITQLTTTPSTGIYDQYVVSGVAVPMTASWSMVNIVAPEPGSMAALALGVAGLLRGRRRRQV